MKSLIKSHGLLVYALPPLLLAMQLGAGSRAFGDPTGNAEAVPFLTEPLSRLDEFIGNHCLECHSSDEPAGGPGLGRDGFDLGEFDLAKLVQSPRENAASREAWELVFKRIASRQMPPPNPEVTNSENDASRPSDETYAAITRDLSEVLDHVAEADPVIPRVDSMRRMTRTEYQNAVRDLLGVQIDAADWLPKDESSQGFDNITTRELSPALVSRYLTAAQHIARVAVGRPTGIPMGVTVRLPADLTQERHLEGLPLGTRGGVNIRHTFAESGIYEVAIRLTRDRDEMVEGLFRKHDIDVLVDRSRKDRITVHPPKDGKDYTHIDTNLKTRLPIQAGQRDVAVTFVSQGDSLIEIKRQPFDAAYNRHRHPRQQPAIFEVTIVGPLPDADATPETPDKLATPINTQSRKRIFGGRWQPDNESLDDLLKSAEEILTPLIRRAYRREVEPADLVLPMRFVSDALQTRVTTSGDADVTDSSSTAWTGRFETGIENAIASILVNPHFFLRIEREATDAEERENAASESAATPIGDYELASRLSFFLWSSLPDTELLDLAKQGRLQDRETLRTQVTRMLADDRSQTLVTNFASQWLHLRNLDSMSPDLRQFPDFDENLRRSFRRETELLVDHVIRNDLSVMHLIDSDVTFLNDRLAQHYGIAGVTGNHFREVVLKEGSSIAKSRRGGLLRHGSILSVTSYATRTSPTIRGNWVLRNLLGTPPPPAPPNVPALKEKSAVTANTVRERLELHRSDPACASCHALIDPVGFALDQFDAVGRWRAYDGDSAVDASGVLPDGTQVTGVEDLERSMTANPDQFASTMTEKLMTFGLGRGVDYRDAGTVRSVVQAARENEYQFSTLIQAIVASDAFRKQ